MKIEKICYEFDPEAVLAGIETEIYDFEASAERYMELCKSALCEAYSEATIEVRKAYGARTQYLVNDSDIHSETSVVENICLEIWSAEDDYKVKHLDVDSMRDAEQLAQIDEIYEEFGVSIGLLRWVCKNELIDGANRIGLIWVLTRLNFRNFQRTFLKGNNDASIWRIKQIGGRVASITGIDYAEFLKQKIGDGVSNEAMLLITSDMFGMPPPFNLRNSYVLVSLNQGQKLITFALFDDIERWTHALHPFSRFRDSLYKRMRPNKRYKIRKVEEHTSKRTVEYSLEVNFVIENVQDSFETCIAKYIEELRQLVEDTEIELANGLPWDKKYEEDEKPFQKYLQKLIELMDYDVVKLDHGQFEFGKDIIFAETTKFGIRRYYAIQAKKGNLSGDAKSAIDEILTQMEDAFSVPFREQQTLEHKYISTFIIAISGEFTNNAKEKIWARLLRHGRVGLVYLWDKNVVQDLMRMSSLKDKKLSDKTLQSMMHDYL